MIIQFQSIFEQKPAAKWQAIYHKHWEYYKKWFLSEGEAARQGYLTSFSELKHYMPELIPIYNQLIELSGGNDLEARFLTQYCPPPYLSACSQIAWTKDRNALIRNYDYSPKLFDGILYYTNWLQPVICMSDCLWGALDGINNKGLAVSLTFGGNKINGKGFGIPLILRYILETCENVAQAIQVLKRIPVSMPYNVTILDAFHQFATVYVAPNKNAEVNQLPIATNHQQQIDWIDYAKITATIERYKHLENCLAQPYSTEFSVICEFLQPPLYNNQFSNGFGTLYTAAYRPLERAVQLYWKDISLIFGFEYFEEQELEIRLL